MTDPFAGTTFETRAERKARLATTPAETPTMRGSCIEAIMAAHEWSSFFGRDEAASLLDAALRKMLEPSEGMLDAATAHHQFIGHPEAKQSSIDRQLNGYRLAADDYWRAMIQHILEGEPDA